MNYTHPEHLQVKIISANHHCSATRFEHTKLCSTGNAWACEVCMCGSVCPLLAVTTKSNNCFNESFKRDSGSPLVCLINRRWKILGVVSYVTPNARSTECNNQTVMTTWFTRIARHCATIQPKG